MNENVWVNHEVMAILSDARERLRSLGAVCQLEPVEVPGEGMTVALYVAASARAAQASSIAANVGAELLTGNTGKTVLAERVALRKQVLEK